MVQRDDIISLINLVLGRPLLDKVQLLDKSANGIQVHGAKKVTKLATGVSMNLQFLQAAVDWGANFVICHHGLNLSERHVYNAKLDKAAQKRLKLVFENDITAAGYHASLDKHHEIGNNSLIVQKLGAQHSGLAYFDQWGWVGEFDKPVSVNTLKSKCKKLFSHDIYTVLSGPTKIKRIGVCSGGAKPVGKILHEIYDHEIDLHLSGEIVEGIDHLARESEFNYFACGHYATEIFGVQALGNKIQQHFGQSLEVKFIDIPNIL